MSRQATKAVGNRYYEARMRAAKYNEKLLTRAGAIEYLPGVTEGTASRSTNWTSQGRRTSWSP